MRPRIREAVVVEGRYDKSALAQVVDAPIVTLDGFAAYHDREKLAYLRRLAEIRGLILLTDSDGAGFQLRGWLKGALSGTLPADRVKQAYVPEITGKERRKRKAGKAGLLGVEGMRPEVLLDALRRAGATFLDEAADAGNNQSCQDNNLYSDSQGENRTPVTKADLYVWGLSGGADSARRRQELLARLSLPRKLNANALLEALNLLYTREELEALLRESGESGDGGYNGYNVESGENSETGKSGKSGQNSADRNA